MSRKDQIEPTRSSAAEYLTFVAASGGDEQSVELRYEDENVWLTQKLMATLYGVDVRTISEHLRNIFGSGELLEERTIRKFRIVQSEGSRDVARTLTHCSRDSVKLRHKDEIGHAATIRRHLP